MCAFFRDDHVSLVKHIRHLVQIRRIGKDLVIELPAVISANTLVYYLNNSDEISEDEKRNIKVEEDGGVVRITVKDSADVYDELVELLYEDRHA